MFWFVFWYNSLEPNELLLGIANDADPKPLDIDGFMLSIEIRIDVV